MDPDSKKRKLFSTGSNVSSTSSQDESSKTVHLDDPHLNAEEALFDSSVKVKLPCSEAPIFNNLSEYVTRTLGSKAKKASEDPALLQERAEKLKQDCSAP